MTKKKTSSTPDFETTIVRETPMVVHSISALLHTMRAIDRSEEPLCTLMCDIKSAGFVTQAARDELSVLLDDIPSHDFLVDLQSVGLAIGRAPLIAIPKQKKAKKRGKRKKEARKKAGKKDRAGNKKVNKRKNDR
jgi:hypothetical protein